MFGVLVYDVLFFGVPGGLILAFVIALYRYFSAKKENARNPGTFSEEELIKRKLFLIVSSIIMGVFLVVVIGFMALLFMAVAFM